MINNIEKLQQNYTIHAQDTNFGCSTWKQFKKIQKSESDYIRQPD